MLWSSSTGHQANTSQVCVVFTQTPVISPWTETESSWFSLSTLRPTWNWSASSRQNGTSFYIKAIINMACLHVPSYLELASQAASKKVKQSKSWHGCFLYLALILTYRTSLHVISFVGISLSHHVHTTDMSPAGAWSLRFSLWPFTRANHCI